MRGDTSGIVRVSATKGTATSATDTVRVATPRDGVADNVTANLTIRVAVAPPADTTHIIIIATVVDSGTGTGLAGATVTVTSTAGGIGGGTTHTATGTTDASGHLLLSEPWGTATTGATATVTMTGYTSRTVARATMARDTINLGTVRLVALTVGQTVSYIFSGTVRNDTGGTATGAVVHVTLTEGGTTILDASNTIAAGGGFGGAGGRYADTARIAYSTAAMSVTITATLAGYTTFDTTFTPAVGTNTVNIVLRKPISVVNRVTVVPASSASRGVSLFLVNGRHAGVPARAWAGGVRTLGAQTMITTTKQGDALTIKKAVTIR